jgi:hypothetical protein
VKVVVPQRQLSIARSILSSPALNDFIKAGSTIAIDGANRSLQWPYTLKARDNQLVDPGLAKVV